MEGISIKQVPSGDGFQSVPGRLLLDTCILHHLYDYGELIFEGETLTHDIDPKLRVELESLHDIFLINKRARIQFVISPLTVAEVANTQDFQSRETRLRWVLDVLDHWLIMLEEIDSYGGGGDTVRRRFKLTPELQKVEEELMRIADLRRDPFDRLLLLQYRMGSCDAFLTTDVDTLVRHRSRLLRLGFRVLRPSEFWTLLKPWAKLWI